MALIHHTVSGHGQPSIVFVHGFACAHTDWDKQVAHLAPYHQTIAVDLRGHGASPGSPDECSIERYGADVAEAQLQQDAAERDKLMQKAQERAELGFDNLRLAADGVFTATTADGKIAAQDAINAALEVLRAAINKSAGIALL